MKKKLLLLSGVFLIVTYAASALAAVTLKRLGASPFSLTPITTKAGVYTLLSRRTSDLRTGFAKAGAPDLLPEFMAQLPAARIWSIRIAPGERFEWMLFMSRTTGTIKVLKDVTWGGKAAFDAFSFHIDKDGQRYEFIVPVGCGNPTLRSVSAIPAPAVVVPKPAAVVPEPANQMPVCRMTLSGTEIKCGQVLTVDASASNDPDGTISEMVFNLLDTSKQVVAEKIDKEAPFVQEFTIPCDSSRYIVKAVAIDNKGDRSSSDDCNQAITIVRRKGGPVANVGVARQLNSASYVFGRVGYEVPLTEKIHAMGLVGGFARFDGEDGGSAFTADALLNYYFTEKMFAGGGIGFWSGNDGKADLIVNLGYLVYEKPESFKTFLLLEGRCEADDLVSSHASRLGLGLLFQF